MNYLILKKNIHKYNLKMEQIKESVTDLEEFIKMKNELNNKLLKVTNLEERIKMQEIKIEKQISDLKKLKKIIIIYILLLD